MAVVLHQAEAPEALFVSTVEELVGLVSGPAGVAIDIPIGLPASGFRPADLAARRFVGPRWQSVFLAPVRSALLAATYEEAQACSVRATGKGISKQAYSLKAKILEVERWPAPPSWRVWEVHPEVSFTLLMGAPPAAPKKTWAGMLERRDALAGVGLALDDVSWAVASRVGTDDMLDAAVAAWSSRRLLDGHGVSIPPDADLAATGVIWG